MYVTRKYHHRIISILSGLILILLIVLFYILLKPNVLSEAEAPTIVVDSPDTNFASKQFETPETPFLKEEEVVIIEPKTEDEDEVILPITKVLFEYIEIINGCGPHFGGECLNVRSGPGTDYPVVAHLRNGMVLKIDGKVERDDYVWYKIIFDEKLRYPERLDGDWYVAADYVTVLLDEGVRTIWSDEYATTSDKQILINRNEQMLYAYDGDVLFMMQKISTGLELTPTPKGTFSIFRKTPSRYMQGPLPGIADQYYDLPGVPWNLYFTHEGAVIHGAYWHESFGSQYSHGCVNLPPNAARKLYNWADLGTKVIVEDW